eukprot:comp12801_c0_seq1/m.7942 comp12801_c0_seq1/g.7942  ORF comp12801_c0_seq1/g.7942 comp12801_c0_seq1/m.7942 type:complete len:372 (-) comp12801_c0_seq1:643-1758(-)
MSKGKVSVVGIGALGLCWALSMERAGYDVLGVDIFPDYVQALNDKSFKAREPGVGELLKASKTFRATTSLAEAVEHADRVIFLLVQTPSCGGTRHYDTTHVTKVLQQFARMGVKNKDIVIGCTVMPQFCDNVAKELIKTCEGCHIIYNPEFIAQGDILRGQLNPDMVLIGEDNKASGEEIERIYLNVVENKPVIARMSLASAEITKLSVNCFVTTKISYANMVGDIADRTPGANKNDILAAVGADSRVGSKYLKPGYSYGGPCFPRDNRALGGHAMKVGIKPIIPLATDEYNVYHNDLMAQDLLDQDLEEYTFEDVAYKPNCAVPIVEESAKVLIAERIARAGKKVVIRDRDFIVDAVRASYGNLFSYQFV